MGSELDEAKKRVREKVFAEEGWVRRQGEAKGSARPQKQMLTLRALRRYLRKEMRSEKMHSEFLNEKY